LDASPDSDVSIDYSDTSAGVSTGAITDSLSFRRATSVNADENDVSVHPEASAESMFSLSDQPDFDADAYILIDRRTGQTICSKNAEKRLYPASITKIMTAILAIEMGDMDKMMTASVRAVRDIGPDGSNIGIIAGETMRLDNLLDALLVRSANETANIIAENLCETREEFIALMNAKAVELGARNTNFTNANGVHDTTHYSSAYDLAKIANYAMDNARFREIVAQHSIILAPTNKHLSWDKLSNTNSLLTDESITDFDVTGVKTGYHSAAGYCIVASGKSGGMELLCVVLGVRGEAAGTSARRFKIASDLLSYGFNNFQASTFISDNEFVGTISVLGGESHDTVDAISDGTVRLFLPVERQKWDISRIEYIESEVAAPVESGDIIGYVEFRNAGQFAGRVNLRASSDVPAVKGGVRTPSHRGDTGSARSAISAETGYVTGNTKPPPFEGDEFSNSPGAAGRNAAEHGVTGREATGLIQNAGAGSAVTILSRINFRGILAALFFVLLLLAALISVLRTVNAIRRNKRQMRHDKYHGKLDYPPVRGKYRRERAGGAQEYIKYDVRRPNPQKTRAQNPSSQRAHSRNAYS
jgi:D-alanyl-D-alanine carboxypeptidase